MLFVLIYFLSVLFPFAVGLRAPSVVAGPNSWREDLDAPAPPECESVCVPSLKVTVRPGDIIMVNANHWYHSTLVEPGDISITIGSEYD
ncbi:hypothetical protein HPB48_002332 [Haemaphysalis longicornis]|uniref:Uncharacterized protein n=1 Tax=Haemaphysalis longicornis TaxID=44386 RepID=A0A9J6FS78_HAELO|nr:hypothetical protein HPB48_002332 [Haemaphysalis longicornis]